MLNCISNIIYFCFQYLKHLVAIHIALLLAKQIKITRQGFLRPGMFSSPHTNAVTKTPWVYLTRGVFLTVTSVRVVSNTSSVVSSIAFHSLLSLILDHFTFFLVGTSIGILLASAVRDALALICISPLFLKISHFEILWFHHCSYSSNKEVVKYTFYLK